MQNDTIARDGTITETYKRLNDNPLRNTKENQRIKSGFKNTTVSKRAYTSYCDSPKKLSPRLSVPTINNDFHIAAMLQKKHGSRLKKY